MWWVPVGLSSYLFSSATKRRRLDRRSLPRLVLRTSAATGRSPPLPDKTPLTNVSGRGLVRSEVAVGRSGWGIRYPPPRRGGGFPEQAPVVSGEVPEVMKTELTGHRGDRARLQPRPNRVQAKSLVVRHRPEAVPLTEREPQGPVADAEFPAEVDCAEPITESGPHELLGSAEQQ